MKYRNLTWCFTTKFGKYKNNDYILCFYKLSMIRAKEFGHTVSFYGCEYSINFLKGYYDNFVDISDKNFDLVDDLKMYVHENGDIDTITIDGDLILNSKLTINDSVDVVYDQKEPLNTKWSPIYNTFIPTLKKYPIEDVIEGFKFNTPFAVNVGILKFNNIEVKNLFIKKYKEFKKYYLESIEPIEEFKKNKTFISIIICQFLFGSLITEKNISSIGSKWNKNQIRTNYYSHWYGYTKFSSEAKESFNGYPIKLPTLGPENFELDEMKNKLI
jgi:hypothetical protein